MLRVVSESTDTCSHRKGGFTCKHMYLFVLQQPGEALLCEEGLCCHPPRPSFRAGIAILQGAEPSCSPGDGDYVEQSHQQGQCCREHQICVTASHTGVPPQAPPAPSTVPPEQENLLGAAPRRELLASQAVFGLPRLPQEGGGETSTCTKPHRSPKPSFQALQPPRQPAHTELHSCTGLGAQGDHYLIFVPLFQQAWKQDMQERYCQQHSPFPALSARESPTTHPLPASAGADSLQSPRASNALLFKKKKTQKTQIIYNQHQQSPLPSKEAIPTHESKATGPDT